MQPSTQVQEISIVDKNARGCSGTERSGTKRQCKKHKPPNETTEPTVADEHASVAMKHTYNTETKHFVRRPANDPFDRASLIWISSDDTRVT